MEEKTLSTEQLFSYLKSALGNFPDNRASNSQYSMNDIVMSAFSVFYMQSPSFLQNQELMRKTIGQDNGKTLFGIDKIPQEDQIRRILDQVSADELETVYQKSIQYLADKQKLKEFEIYNGKLLVAFDGTQYFCSDNISCQYCSTRTKSGTVQYHHNVLNPVIVHPEKPYALPLEPEFITPQDGNSKQDCENMAMKRWLSRFPNKWEAGKIIYLGDDLYSKTPLIEKVKETKQHFLFVCKPQSHKHLYKDIEGLEKIDEVNRIEKKIWTGRQNLTYTYRYVNKCDLTADKKTEVVNWFELVVYNEKGSKKNHFSFVTDIEIDEKNIEELISFGRTRWKIENEAYNTLKNHGYHMEHNFGHGKKNLSRFLLSLNLIAFLFHSICEICDPLYSELRNALHSRRTFFKHLDCLSCYLIFENWNTLLRFMLMALEKRRPPPADYLVNREYLDALK